jgi:hypothetical protein
MAPESTLHDGVALTRVYGAMRPAPEFAVTATLNSQTDCSWSPWRTTTRRRITTSAAIVTAGGSSGENNPTTSTATPATTFTRFASSRRDQWLTLPASNSDIR